MKVVTFMVDVQSIVAQIAAHNPHIAPLVVAVVYSSIVRAADPSALPATNVAEARSVDQVVVASINSIGTAGCVAVYDTANGSALFWDC